MIFISCKKEYSCEGCAARPIQQNHPPIARAGADQTIFLPTNTTNLDGSGSTDPDSNIIIYTWTKISGPSTFNIVNANATQTQVTGIIEGSYLFELKVTDSSGLSDKDTVQIRVNNGPQTNRPPVANAGVDQLIILPLNSVNLNGNSSTDPDNNILSYLWTKISGPAWFAISNGNLVQAQVTNMVEGIYFFELRVTDAGGLYDLDTIKIIIENTRCDNSNRSFINAQLIPIGTLSIARQELSVAAAGNKIVFAGGIQAAGGSGMSESAAVDIYDLVTQTWSTASLSAGRATPTAISSGNKIFFAGGGYYYTDYFSNVDIYDVSINTWTTTSLTEAKTGIGAAVVGNKILFAGGYRISGDLGPNNAVKTIEIYDLTTNTWSLDILSEARGYVCGITVGNKVFFAGGMSSWGTNSNQIDIYNNSNNSWSTSSLGFVEGALTGVTVAEKIYWAGIGCDVEMYNSVSGVSSGAFLYKKDAYQSVVKDGKVIFLRYQSDMFDIYDPVTNLWSVGKLPFALPYRFATICVNNIIYIAGGGVGTNILANKVYKLEF